MSIIDTDKALMQTLNAADCHNAMLDSMFYLVSQTWTWIPMYLVLLYLLIKNKKKESLLLILSIIIMVILCDQTASGILKPLVKRLRPSHDSSIMDLLAYVGDYRGGKYGFPSSHAANTFGLATFLMMMFKNKITTASMFIWATITAYSRIYLGVHYPGDILVGIIIGLIWGYLCYWGYIKIRQKDFCRTYINEDSTGNGSLVSYTMFGILIIIVAVSIITGQNIVSTMAYK